MDKGQNGNGIDKIQNKWQAFVRISQSAGILSAFLAFMWGVHDLYVRQAAYEETSEKTTLAIINRIFDQQNDILEKCVGITNANGQ